MVRRSTSPGQSGQQLADGDEVAEALRHLLAFDLQEAVVHPDIRHAIAAEARSAIARSRSRDAGTRGRCRRHGCRTVSPRCFHAIAEHSMCQPGRPGAAMPARRRPARLARPSTASTARSPSRRACRARHRRGRRRSSRRASGCDELAVVPAIDGDAEQHVVFGDIGMAAVRPACSMIVAHLGDVLGGARLDRRRAGSRAPSTSSWKLRVGLLGQLADRLVQLPSISAARALILSSTSVMLRT